ncbi:alpha/beta hydrolase [Thalassotalea maritima]|uniref:alpha/beta hydrolase n=1 Tax=Thalassotalea maritima TaxID=3242416 RepID=UPI00352739EF
MQAITLNTSVGQLAANLYLPTSNIAKKPPVVIITGAWTTVKEQMPAVYAVAFADKGFAALTFDFRGWGQSDDAVKYLEDPQRKTEDIRAVIKALEQISDIDPSKVFGLGICASTGYMLDAVTDNDKVTAVAAVAPWIHNSDIANQVYGGENQVNELIELANQAALKGGVFIEAASMENDKALMYQAPYYTETNRGLIPEYDNQFNVASWLPWLTYDALKGAKSQDKSVLLVASEAMALPDGARQYLSQSGDNVSSVWLDNISQFDFYDVPSVVERATSAISKHFCSYTNKANGVK